MEDYTDDAGACPLTDLPAACLRGILQCLWPDARDAAAFACCCSTIRTLCDDQLLWRELLVKRYGERVIPGMKPTPGAFAAQRRLAVLHQAPKHHHSMAVC
jgi:hypothetical protein